MQNGIVDIQIEYCATWGHAPRAVRLTAEILEEREIEYSIRSWQMIPSTGGVFEVTLNGELIFSKKTLGRHAEDGEIKQLIVDKIAELRSDE